MEEPVQESELEQQLERIAGEAGDLISPCRYKSSFQIYGDLRDRARRGQQLYYYALGTFFQMDQAQYLLDFQTMRERAIELIALMESEESCRKIQPDVEIPIYEHLVYTMSACAYENLAEATGQMDGYNSEGLQACIADGIQVCRQTGKLPCVGCFREYSCDVYMAADDSEIARHQCTLVLEQASPPSDRGDRRWLAKKKIAWMTALEGRLGEAIDLMNESLVLTDVEGVSLKLESRCRVLFDMDAILIAAGKAPMMPNDPQAANRPPQGECPLFDLMSDLNKALSHTVKEQWDAATEILTQWDRTLQEKKAMHQWFEVRLRLVAMKRLSGEEKQADRLASQLEKRASAASDWLTLRRLGAIQDPDMPTSPLGIFGPITLESEPKSNRGAGSPDTKLPDTKLPDAKLPDAKQGASSKGGDGFVLGAEKTSGLSQREEDEKRRAQQGGPLKDRIMAIGEKMQQIEADDILGGINRTRNELMQIEIAEVIDDHDACMMLHLMSILCGDCSDANAIWKWANQVAANFQEDPTAISLLATVGDRLRFGDNPTFAETMTAERTEPLFRKSLQIGTDQPMCFMRAGDHYMSEGNQGEAERCYARAFRLRRYSGDIALRLAALYQETDRTRDALHVLDVALREGTDEPSVAWEAALVAFGLQRHEAMLTYLDRFEKEAGEVRPWMNYYRSIGLLSQGDATGALKAIQAERELIEEDMLHTAALFACTNAKVGNVDEAVAAFQQVLNMLLHQVSYMSPSGISHSLGLCYESVKDDLNDAVLTGAFRQLLLQAGMANDAIMESERGGETQSVELFRVLLVQPLDDQWSTFAGCLDGQQEWNKYLAEWGVLASDEEAAVKIAKRWQSQCYPLDSELEAVFEAEQQFEDSPGAVWQGMRLGPATEEETDQQH